MLEQTYVSSMGATQITVGLSQIIRVTPPPNMIDGKLKILSGGGTLEVVQTAFSGTSTAATSGWGKGYPLGASEVLPIPGPATFYLAATGATMIAALQVGYTNGATLL